MFNTVLRKRSQSFALVLVLAALLIATTAFAATKLIIAQKGGRINVAEGVVFVIRPGALEEDTVISVDMIRKKKRIIFEFGPDDTRFSRPAELKISWEVLEDVDDFTLYGERGEEILPRKTGWGLIYEIEHFSLFYFRRR